MNQKNRVRQKVSSPEINNHRIRHQRPQKKPQKKSTKKTYKPKQKDKEKWKRQINKIKIFLWIPKFQKNLGTVRNPSNAKKFKLFKEITLKININDSAIRTVIYKEMNCH